MVDFVKRLRNVDGADIRCTTLTNNISDNTANSANSKTAANSFLNPN